MSPDRQVPDHCVLIIIDCLGRLFGVSATPHLLREQVSTAPTIMMMNALMFAALFLGIFHSFALAAPQALGSTSLHRRTDPFFPEEPPSCPKCAQVVHSKAIYTNSRRTDGVLL